MLTTARLIKILCFLIKAIIKSIIKYNYKIPLECLDSCKEHSTYVKFNSQLICGTGSEAGLI